MTNGQHIVYIRMLKSSDDNHWSILFSILTINVKFSDVRTTGKVQFREKSVVSVVMARFVGD